MLKRENRLKNRHEFFRIYSNSTKVINSEIVLYVDKNKLNEQSQTRVGFVVSKKIHKRAVIRNRTKRKLREAVRLILKDNSNPLKHYSNLIFVAKRNLIDVKTAQLKQSILTLADKI